MLADTLGTVLVEHGTPAYHVEFGQGMTYSTPANLPSPPVVPREPVASAPSADVSV